MGSELFGLLIEGALASSAAIIAVLLLRRPWARWFGAAQLRLLWALVPAALLAVALPAPIADIADEDAARIELAPSTGAIADASDAARSLPAAIDAARWIWLIGTVLFAVHFLRQQIGFMRRLGGMSDRGDGVHLAHQPDTSPAVVGLLRPRIVLPADFAQRFDCEQQAWILAHERSHLRGGDLFANALATALRCLYWFNPLIHLAASRLRQDHELASDADVLRDHPSARRRYADTLLNVQLAVPGLPVGCLWQSSHPLKERILMLKHASTSPIRRRTGVAIGLALSLTASVVAWAAQPARPDQAPDAGQGKAVPAAQPTADSEPTYRRLKPPKYPQSALDGGQSGKVVLEVTVAVDGSAAEIKVSEASPPGVFDEVAISTVRQWAFNPAIRDGKPVVSRVLVPICFSQDEQTNSCPGPAAALDGIYIRPPKA